MRDLSKRHTDRYSSLADMGTCQTERLTADVALLSFPPPGHTRKRDPMPNATPPCPTCGVWECLDCNTRTSRRNRYYPGEHHCRTCKSTNGHMLPTRHRSDIHQDHTSELDPQATCHYPLEESSAAGTTE